MNGDDDNNDDLEYQYDSDQEYNYEEDGEEDDGEENGDMQSENNESESTSNNSKINNKNNNDNYNSGYESHQKEKAMKIDDDSNSGGHLYSSSSAPFKTPARVDNKSTTGSGNKTSTTISASGKMKIPDGSYFINDYSVISHIMENLIYEVSSLLDIDVDMALILLQHCKWSKEKLMDGFYSSSQASTKMLEECGLDMFSPTCLDSLKWLHSNMSNKINNSSNNSNNNLNTIQNMNNVLLKMDPISNKPHSPKPPSSSSSSQFSSSSSAAFTNINTTSVSTDGNNDVTFVCEICGDVTLNIEAVGLGCHHYFCRVCYLGYLTAQVSEGPACIKSHCPQHKCKQAIPRSMVHLLFTLPSLSLSSSSSSSAMAVVSGSTALSAAQSMHKYNVYLLRNFIEMTKGLQYCPTAGCDKVAVGTGVSTVRCDCGSVFCCRCGEEAHDPCTCAQLADWNQKCINESETANWILANTKKCPNCSSRIEKNQGCNHMNCKVCKSEFCWICMGPWATHGQSTGGYYKCNKFEAGTADSSATAAQKAKMELDRYLHYYQRYHAHDHSLKHAANQRNLAERRMIERQESQRGSAWIDVQFLRQAVEQVIECRRVLKYTYALGYFLTDNCSDKHLFEHHQEMLEKNTEKLHEFTEQPLDSIDRTQVVNLTRVTERFMSEMLTTTEGGIVDTSTAVLLSSSPANLSYLSFSNNNTGSSSSSSGITPLASAANSQRVSLDTSGGSGAGAADASYMSLLSRATGVGNKNSSSAASTRVTSTGSGSSLSPKSSSSSSSLSVTTRSQNKSAQSSSTSSSSSAAGGNSTSTSSSAAKGNKQQQSTTKTSLLPSSK